MSYANRPCIGVVGGGVWGQLILRELTQLSVAVRVADVSSDARNAAVKLGAIEVAASPADFVVDAFVVATPASTHAAVTLPLLDHRVPVLVEKPFTTDLAAARSLAAAGPNQLFVGHVWRYHPGVELLGEIARSGRLGQISGLKTSRTNWTSPRADVDSIWNLVPHDLAIAIEILGEIPTPMAALAEILDGRAVGLYAHLGPGPWAVIEASNRYQDKRREIRLHGKLGVAVLADPTSAEIEITLGDSHSQAGAMVAERMSTSVEPALRRELAAFIRHVEGGPAPKSNAAEGVAVVEAVTRLRSLAGVM